MHAPTPAAKRRQRRRRHGALGSRSLDSTSAHSCTLRTIYHRWEHSPESSLVRPSQTTKVSRALVIQSDSHACDPLLRKHRCQCLSIPEPYRTAYIKSVQLCNPCKTSSQQKCSANIERSINLKGPIYLVDLAAMLCFIHYCVGETGRNRWLGKSSKAACPLRCAEYKFDWRNRGLGCLLRDRKSSPLPC